MSFSVFIIPCVAFTLTFWSSAHILFWDFEMTNLVNFVLIHMQVESWCFILNPNVRTWNWGARITPSIHVLKVFIISIINLVLPFIRAGLFVMLLIHSRALGKQSSLYISMCSGTLWNIVKISSQVTIFWKYYVLIIMTPLPVIYRQLQAWMSTDCFCLKTCIANSIMRVAD